MPQTAPITRLLIANRGEIALRIARACRELGITSIAVYSDADRHAPHVQAADEAVHIGPTPAAASYLNIDAVLAAAQAVGADALHPGYGFLSENADFADACAAAGLTFVGPSGSAMRALGDKATAKELARKASVPTVPEWPVDDVPADAFPVLIKASAGGGGRGMRVVDHPDDLAEAAASAAREATAGFGDGTLLVEKLVQGARHVEVQLLADTHGACFAIGDRDCSLQRRHQKVVEEAPAPGIPGEVRSAMHQAAIRLAEAASYANAGTAEFLLAADGSFYFLELNARLQVEHPVTELAFDIDLVQWQLRIAAGERLELNPAQLTPTRHAIEARVYAEDPVAMLPTGGRMIEPIAPTGTGIRVDHALQDGCEVTLAYDPLVAKVIASATDRSEAIERLRTALTEISVPGVVTNTPLLIHAIDLPAFLRVQHSIETLGEHLLTEQDVLPTPHELGAARRATVSAPAPTPFQPDTAPALRRSRTVGDRIWIQTNRGELVADREQISARHRPSATADHGDHAVLAAPMPGTVLRAVEPGTQVKVGDPVVVLEAMKMENVVASPLDGVVAELTCAVGDLVSRGDVLAEVER